MRRFALGLTLVLGSVTACTSDDGGGETTSGAEATTTSGAEGTTGTEEDTGDTAADGIKLDVDGEPPGYYPCAQSVDCPPQHICFVTAGLGGVCAWECLEHSDCPDRPEGTDLIPACVGINDGKGCLLAGCSDEMECPPGMICREGPTPTCIWPE